MAGGARGRSGHAGRAERQDLLNPESPPGRPQFFVEDYPTDVAGMGIEERIAALTRRAEKSNTPRAWLLLGSTLEQAGHRISARAAYDRALRLDPDDLDAKVAAAVGRFDKDTPSDAFSRLGPLARDNPDAAVVRYHLGLLLLWLADLDGAREQLQQAKESEPDGFYGRQAERLLTRLAGVEWDPASRRMGQTAHDTRGGPLAGCPALRAVKRVRRGAQAQPAGEGR